MTHWVFHTKIKRKGTGVKKQKKNPLTTVEDEKISSDRISFEVFGH